MVEKKLTDSQLRYFNKLKTGDVVEGMVTKITRYGAFIKTGSLSGLLHISEITWGRIEDAEDFLKINQRLKVVITETDRQNHLLKFSLKRLLAHPWETLITHYKEGDIVVGQVSEVRDFGAFISLRPGLEGLIHISDIDADKKGKTAHDFFKVDETYQVRITEIDIPRRRMQLSLKEDASK